MQSTNKGGAFIPISRRLFEHHFWCEERCFSKFEAWIDILQYVRFEDTKFLIGNKWVTLKRGQMLGSMRFLARRWNWSTKKVTAFLILLTQNNMILKEVPKNTGQTIITVCNYDSYNFTAENRKQYGDSTETQGKQQGNEYNKDNNVKKGKKLFVTNETCNTNQDITSLPYRNNKEREKEKNCAKKEKTEIRTQQFYTQLLQYAPQYSNTMLNAFFNYWAELNSTGTKMRWEMQKTWELHKRLAYWASNDKKFEKTKPQNSKLDQNEGMLKDILKDIKEGKI